MSNTLSILSSSEPSGIGLKSYNVSLPMGTLAIGVDNIHHDVFLSPKFVQAARDYLLPSANSPHRFRFWRAQRCGIRAGRLFPARARRVRLARA